MGKVRIELDRAEVGGLLLKTGPMLQDLATKVRKEAYATFADYNSETLKEYGRKGFTGRVETRSKRPRAVIESKADSDLALRAQFASQRVSGVAHLRAALYKYVPKTKRPRR